MGNNQTPLDDTILVAVAGLVDDKRSGTGSRMPSHDDIRRDIVRAGLEHLDAGKLSSQPIGKYKRVHGTLIAASSENPSAAVRLIEILLATVRGHGGFRPGGANYCGDETIANLAAAYAPHGWALSSDGKLLPHVLESLAGKETTANLKQYADRARRGALDDPLLAGVAKDLLEATAIHVVIEKHGITPTAHVFPVLLGQAFDALGMQIHGSSTKPGEHARARLERAAFELACSLNALRNKQGTGHGKPWLPDIRPAEARFAIESMGNIASLMLEALIPTPP
jgi:Abortive infection C-terminus